jgi:hypothetical protein
MLHFDASYTTGLHFTNPGFPHAHIVRGAEVRIRYDVAADKREEARAVVAGLRAELLEHAVLVQVEEAVRPSTTARAPEVATARTLGDKLSALWRARGTVPDELRSTRLLGKASDLEARS